MRAATTTDQRFRATDAPRRWAAPVGPRWDEALSERAQHTASPTVVGLRYGQATRFLQRSRSMGICPIRRVQILAGPDTRQRGGERASSRCSSHRRENRWRPRPRPLHADHHAIREWSSARNAPVTALPPMPRLDETLCLPMLARACLWLRTSPSTTR